MTRKSLFVIVFTVILVCIMRQQGNIFREDSSQYTGHLNWLFTRIKSSSSQNSNASEINTPWLLEQDRRRKAVRRACDSMSLSQEELLDLLMVSPGERFSHLLVDDFRKAIYCFIPKVACTNWKKVWMSLVGLTTEKNLSAIPLMMPHEIGYKMQLVKKLEGPPLEFRLNTYKKLIVVRHPFHRLASAYRDKIQFKGDPYFQKQVLPFVTKRRPDAHLENIHWTEFIDYITLGKGKQSDDHWNSYMSLCHPCALNYDVIAKVETLEEDSERFLRLIDAPSDLHFPNTSRTSRRIGSTEWEEYEKQLSSEQLAALRKVYARDFRLFEYI